MQGLPNIVLVHGSWTDGSSWSAVIEHARLTIYGDSARGSLFQHHRQFATDANAFLDETT